MTSVPRPEPGELLLSDGSSVAAAVSEVVAVGVVFIVLAHVAVGVFDIEAMMPSFLTGPERAVGATFMVGAAVQISLVLILSLLFTDLRRAVGNSVKFGTIPGWSVAVMAAAIHAATIAVFFLDEPGRIFEQSSRNLLLSVAPAVDGWSQEVLFRGYVIYRLARGGLPVAVQIGVSAHYLRRFTSDTSARTSGQYSGQCSVPPYWEGSSLGLSCWLGAHYYRWFSVTPSWSPSFSPGWRSRRCASDLDARVP